ncbi:type IV pilus modification protein PilV [Aquitalea palustris]|uniref:Type IV pilus modification protein PilV n=1 Tax=Aquitalea palustris TaxID=2480983 RepID=A0A454JI98_9NEIS|nr:type IV pilus modification protein PilV [Aquitalea palustris]RMC97208.1 type IV pilus modification protein PilV [Aquitalea palustris]
MTPRTGIFPRSEAGVTMIEVLVVLVIVAIGLLGVAALQLNNLRYSSLSSGRQQAALVAEQMADRMRANPNADYSSASGSYSGNCYAATTNCPSTTPANRAAFDLSEIQAIAASSGLSSSTVSVSKVSSGSVVFGYQVTVSWQERATSVASQTATASMSVLVRP